MLSHLAVLSKQAALLILSIGFACPAQHKDTVLQCLHASALVSEANLGFCCKDTSQ